MSRLLLIAFLGLGPLQWITLADVGLSLKPVHLPFFIAAGWGYLMLLRGARPAVGGFLATFTLFYIVYVLAMTASLMQGGQAIYTAKIVLHFLAAIGFFVFLTRMSRADLFAGLLYGGLVATIGFFVVAAITLGGRGVNMFEVIFRALATGNPALLQFKIFLNLFNESVTDADRVGAALRHTVMGFIFLSLLSAVYCLLEQGRRIAWVTIGLAVFILMISVSRSQILATTLALTPLMLSYARRGGILVPIVLLGIGIGGTLFVTSSASDGIFAIIDQRFGNFGQDGRVAMFEATLGEIDRRPLAGYGAGVGVDYGGRELIPVHNLILAAWHQAGLVALVAALGFTLSLLGLYVTGLAGARARPELLAVAGLLVLPMFRSQVSGAGGNYTLPEWGCILVAFALVLRVSSRAADPDVTPDATPVAGPVSGPQPDLQSRLRSGLGVPGE